MNREGHPRVEGRMTPATFSESVNVSRETLERLQIYVQHLLLWQARINLVSNTTLADPWRRHILDSAQLLAHLPVGPGPVIDLGSGAGFPGLVVAVLGARDVVLVESDARKVAFLREVSAQTGTAVTIHGGRAEALSLNSARAVTARGFAPLVRLLPVAVPLLREGGVAVLLKGKRHQEEATEARAAWQFTAQTVPSRSDPAGVILRLTDIHRL